MKRVFSFALCAIMMAVCSTAVQAQDKPSKKQRISREELAWGSRHVTSPMNLHSTMPQRRSSPSPVRITRKRYGRPGRPKKHDGLISVEERLEHSQKILDLRWEILQALQRVPD